MATSFIADINNLVSKAKSAGLTDTTATKVVLCSFGSSGIVGLVYNG